MDKTIINKKAEIADIINVFKQNLDLKSSARNERRLKILKKCIERNEKIVNDQDETDIEYINDELNNIKTIFNNFCDMYNIDNTPKNESVFIKTPDLIKNKKCAINQQNNNNKCFQYSVTLSLIIKKLSFIRKE